ncbi:MAG TPA: hypothetical protein ENI87_00265, partial [bacterium]|nr:hypothetical protein [bacterium]
MTNAAKTDPKPENWLDQQERGSIWVLWLTFRTAQLLGRTLMKPLVLVVALFYRLIDRRAVRASRDWLRRVHGREPGFWQVFRHIHTFAQVTLDRILLVSGRTRAFEFTLTGNHFLREQLATGRGAILLGAHLGSFEAMRSSSINERIRINIVGHFENAAR